MNITKVEMQAVFTEWDKRFIETPEEYLSHAEMVELGVEEAAKLSMNYFLTILKEVRNDRKTE